MSEWGSITLSKKVFVASLIATAVISGFVVFYAMEWIQPRPRWTRVLSSFDIPSNVTTWTSDTFQIDRMIAISWYGVGGNVTRDVTVYNASDEALSTYSDMKQDDFTEIYRGRGMFKITVVVSGMTPIKDATWHVTIWDQRYPP